MALVCRGERTGSLRRVKYEANSYQFVEKTKKSERISLKVNEESPRQQISEDFKCQFGEVNRPRGCSGSF
mgnify:CR=1 FL=1